MSVLPILSLILHPRKAEAESETRQHFYDRIGRPRRSPSPSPESFRRCIQYDNTIMSLSNHTVSTPALSLSLRTHEFAIGPYTGPQTYCATVPRHEPSLGALTLTLAHLRHICAPMVDQSELPFRMLVRRPNRNDPDLSPTVTPTVTLALTRKLTPTLIVNPAPIPTLTLLL